MIEWAVRYIFEKKTYSCWMKFIFFTRCQWSFGPPSESTGTQRRFFFFFFPMKRKQEIGVWISLSEHADCMQALLNGSILVKEKKHWWLQTRPYIGNLNAYIAKTYISTCIRMYICGYMHTCIQHQKEVPSKLETWKNCTD